jgi:hypothetical protein
MQKILNSVVRALSFVSLFGLSLNALADPLVSSSTSGNPDLTTIYVIGDPENVAMAFNTVASFFGNGLVGDSFMGSLMLVAALISLASFLYTSIFKMKFEAGAYLMTLLLALVLFVPKTTVYVKSYFDENGSAAGATKFIPVDNIPIGIAYPLGFAGAVAAKLTSKYDTWSVLPGSSAEDEGGFLSKGLDGYFSPLKSMLKLRELTVPSLIVQNLRTFGEKCNAQERTPLLQQGVKEYLTLADDSHPFRGEMIGIFDNARTGKTEAKDMQCALAGHAIYAQMLAYTEPGTDGLSPALRNLYSKTDVGQARGKSVNASSAMKAKSTETTEGIESVMRKMGVEPTSMANGVTQAALQRFVEAPMVTEYQSLAAAVGYTNQAAQNAAVMQANILFSNAAAKCALDHSNACYNSEMVVGEAVSRGALNAAGEAGVYSAFMTHGANVMIYLYVIIAPLIVLVGLAMGVGGLKIWGSYLLFAVWVNSWLPVTGAIASYMSFNYNNRIEQLGLAYKAVGSGQSPMIDVFNPAALQSFLTSTQNMLTSASTLMASAPLISLALLSGSIFGLVSMAGKMSMPDSVDENKLAPQLDKSTAVNSDAFMKQMQKETGHAVTNQAGDIGGASLKNELDPKISMRSSDGESAKQMSQLSHQFQEQSSLAAQSMASHATQSGFTAQVTNGSQVTISNGTGFSKTYDAKNGTSSAETLKADITANGGLKAFGTGAGVSGSSSANSATQRSQGLTDSNSESGSKDTKTSSGNSTTSSKSTTDSFQDTKSKLQAVSDTKAKMDTLSSEVSHGRDARTEVSIASSTYANTAHGLSGTQLHNAEMAAAHYDTKTASEITSAFNSGGESQAASLAFNKAQFGTASEQAAAKAHIASVMRDGGYEAQANAAEFSAAQSIRGGAVGGSAPQIGGGGDIGMGSKLNPEAARGMGMAPSTNSGVPHHQSIPKSPSGGGQSAMSAADAQFNKGLDGAKTASQNANNDHSARKHNNPSKAADGAVGAVGDALGVSTRPSISLTPQQEASRAKSISQIPGR